MTPARPAAFKTLIEPRIKTPPLPVNEIAGLLNEAADTADAKRAAAALKDVLNASVPLHRLIGGIFAASPFLAGIIQRRPELALALIEGDPGEQLGALNATLWPEISVLEDETAAMRQLRLAREHAALAVALADLGGIWPVMTAAEHLSDFAEAALRAAVNWLIMEAARRGRIAPPSPDTPAKGCGYAVLGMGKLGARELNYSSDIDLIVLYDGETAPMGDGVEPQRFFVRLTQRLVKLLQEQSADGYVFRTDLRLRPDPGATAVAINLEAASQYYETLGQNWERAAMIKARAVAGDQAVADAFFERLKPFIWRKALDFASIADIHSMKRQIHSHKGHGAIKIAGHNIKLGRGGIREVEFFVQTQQLIAGGRIAGLRSPRTLVALDRLAEHGWIDDDARDEMGDAYCFLRDIEHRLQMRSDEQTHTLPDEDKLEEFAKFAGFDTGAAFAEALNLHLSRVQSHYAALFEDAPDLAADHGSLVFTGGEDDPDTLETLTAMGFKRASELSSAVRAWHFGRYGATRSARAREILTELMPHLLSALARTANPDAAFTRFDGFLQSLPAGVQLFSMLRANPRLLDLIATIMGTAPRLAGMLGREVRVLDAVLDDGFFTKPLELADVERQMVESFGPAARYEDILDQARMIAHDDMFRIGVQLLTGTLPPARAGEAYADLAAALVRGLSGAVALELSKAHGVIADGRFVVLAMGKFGGCEMAATSDLDLMVIYDTPEDAPASNGKRPLDPVTYYARFAQRLISALSVPTAQGALYEVDMRLRPSGRAGPVATRLESFAEYQMNEAWTWEHMALTRARPVAGDETLAGEVMAVIERALTMGRDPAKLRAEVAEMRARIEQSKAARHHWHLKEARGGLIDLEFICQYLQLAHGAETPYVFDHNTKSAFEKLAVSGALDARRADILNTAYDLMTALSQILRLCVEHVFEAENAPQDLKALMARAVGEPDFSRVAELLIEQQSAVKSVYDEMLG